MPLSEREQKLLEQMEQALSQEDPRLASAFRQSRSKALMRRAVGIAVIGVILGLALLVVGVLISQVVVSILGFLLMFAAVMVAVAMWHRASHPPATLHVVGSPPTAGPGSRASDRFSGKKPAKRTSSGTFMQRLEQRWDRRRDERGGL